MQIKQIKSKFSFLYLASIILFVGIACANRMPKSAQYSNPFNGQQWILTAINGIPIDSIPLSMPSIVFDTNSKMTGHFGCNTFFGSYLVVNKKKIYITYNGSTKMLCPDMELEKRFASALKSEISHYQADNNTLILLNKDGEVLRFRRE